MKAKSSPREKSFVPGTSRNREAGVTFRLEMARDQEQLLAMGARIKELREAHGYKQQWIADKVGVNLRTYQFWQEGKSPPGQDNLEKLAELFGVTGRYIMRGETPDPFGDGNRLQRIEAKLDRLLKAMGIEPTDEELQGALERELSEAAEQAEASDTSADESGPDPAPRVRRRT